MVRKLISTKSIKDFNLAALYPKEQRDIGLRRPQSFMNGAFGDKGVSSAIAIYRKVKQIIPNIAAICTDANSCYDIAFQRFNVPELHIITKAKTHLIESSNSSIRDKLARFNRKSKRYSKSWEMPDISLNLFFNRHQLQSMKS